MQEKFFGKIPYKYIFISVWAICILGVLAMAGSFMYVAKTKMPDTSELENPTFEESSIVYSEDGVEIDRYFRKNRQWVQFEDLSPHLVNALISTEDKRYHQHSGIDAYGTARAAAYFGRNGGGSTITQQLAKQFYTPTPSGNPIKRVWQKMKEWVIAAEFEKRYTKEEILAMFLNKFDFNNQGNGVGAASLVYFGKNQKDLTIPEAAMLVGMLNGPTLFSPVRNPERALRKRNMVMRRMWQNDIISQAKYDSLKIQELDMSSFNKGENYGGLAPHFMAELKKELRILMVEKGITKPGGESYNLDTDGLRIYSTIDTRYQKHAEAAARKHMIKQQATFAKAWENKDPWLKFKYLGKIIDEIKAIIPDARLYEGDIRRILKAEKDDAYLAKLLKDDFIRKDQKVVYEKILKLEEYSNLKNQWTALRKAVKQEANRERPMKLYSYEGIIEQTMTPIDSLKYMNMFLQLGSVSIEPSTGYVRAWVGGTDYNIWKYDHVNANRQVGSTFKPFLYTAAISSMAMQPCRKVLDQAYVISSGDGDFKLEKTWDPKNSRGKYSNEEVTLKEALKLSLNSISVWLMKEMGSVNPLIQIASAMGIPKQKIPPYPAIILGTPDITVLDLTTAYSTFANNGIKTKPSFIKRIEYEGMVIYENEIEQSRAINEEVNYAMVDLLKHAASSRQYALKTSFGGKTGTTNDHVDGWFVGITPDLVTGTWVGGDQPWIRYLTLTLGQGGQMARPYFIDFMQRVEADEDIQFNTKANFYMPPDMGIITNCSQRGHDGG